MAQVTRRSFIASAPAAAAATREPVVLNPVTVSAVHAQADPIRIATLYRFEPHEIEQIRAAVPGTGVELKVCGSREEYREALKDAEVVYGGVTGADLDSAPRLKWVQAGGAGVEGLDKKFIESPVVLTNYARTFAPGISETAKACCCASRAASRNTTCRSSRSASGSRWGARSPPTIRNSPAGPWASWDSEESAARSRGARITAST